MSSQIYHIKLYFQDFSITNTVATGYSEDYWCNCASNSIAQTSAQALVTGRLTLLCADQSLTGVRISLTGAGNRGSIVPNNMSFPQTGTWLVGSDKTSASQLAILAKWTNNNNQNQNHYMRGIPQLQLQYQKLNFSGPYGTLLAAWSTTVQTYCQYRQIHLGVVNYTSPVTNVFYPMLVSRRVGRPFFVAHGRRVIR